jgi:integrase
MENVDKLTENDVKTKKKEVHALNYDEVMKLWDEMLRKNEKGNVINGKVGTYVYGIGAYALLFCCFTGLRWGEVSCLRWEDIQQSGDSYYFKVDKQFVTIKDRGIKGYNGYKTIETSPKSEKSERYIPLSKKAKGILDLVADRFPEHYKSKHLIFSTTNNTYSNSVANRLLKVMCIRAEIPIVTPHALRHSFASILLNEDEKNLYAVSDLLGHSSSDVTYKRYIDIFEKNKVNTINIFDNLE